MQQFQISLKNEKVKQYDRIALFITIINLSLFIYVAFAVTNKQDRIAAIAGAALVLSSHLCNFNGLVENRFLVDRGSLFCHWHTLLRFKADTACQYK